jgi:hypothetical protein
MSGKTASADKKSDTICRGHFHHGHSVSFSVKSNLVCLPSPRWVWRSPIFPLSPWLLDSLFYLFSMLLQALILRAEYRIVNYSRLQRPSHFGFFTDLTTRLVSLLPVSEITLFGVNTL